MDVIWPKKNKDLGARVNYRCPFRRGTETHVLKGKHLLITALNKYSTKLGPENSSVNSFVVVVHSIIIKKGVSNCTMVNN